VLTSYGEWQSSIASVLKVLKTRFPNLTTEEAFDLAAKLVDAVLVAHGSPHG
jgi:hypothetical protein